MTSKSWKTMCVASVLGAFMAVTATGLAKAPKPKDPPSKWRDYINKDYKPTPRPKSSPVPGRFKTSGTRSPFAKDAPSPKDPPHKWRDTNMDYKPKPRPKSSPFPSRFGKRGSNTPRAKDATKPKDPPSKWRDYINKDYKPTPRPKSAPVPSRFGKRGSNAPRAKDAPKPKDPPGKWRDYINKDYKPTPRPKSAPLPSRFGRRGPASSDKWRDTTYPTKDKFSDRKGPRPRPTRSRMVPDPIRGSWPTRKVQGAPPPQSRNTPRAGKPIPPSPRDVKIPYVHPPRDVKDLKRKTRRSR